MFHVADTPKQKETAKSLISEATDRVALDHKWDPAADVARRLAQLRDEPPPTSEQQHIDNASSMGKSDDHDADAIEEETSDEVIKLLRKAHKESQLAEKLIMDELNSDRELQTSMKTILKQSL